MKKGVLFAIILLLSYVFSQSSHILNIAAGVAIFLFGMFSLEEGFRAFAGGLLERILKLFTDKQYKSLLFGILTTTIMQSSSLVSIVSISFISAGLIGLAQGIGIIFGANIGTTTGAWLIAGLGLKVDIATYAMPMLIFGTLFLFQNEKKLKGIGSILAGLGFLFLGIAYMKEGFEAFKATIDLSQFAVGGFKGLLLFSFIGVVATVIMQSSHASLVLIITALGSGQIDYENALALAIGSNIGTTVTAIIGSLSAGLDGKKLALAHVIFNVLTGFLAITFITLFIRLVDTTAFYLGIAEDDYTMKLALFHTYFNLLGVMLLYPFIDALVRLLHRLLPKAQNAQESDDVYFITDSALDFPSTAYTVLIKETKHLYHNVVDIIAQSLSISFDDILSGMEIDDIIQRRNTPLFVDMEYHYEHRVKEIYGKIITFAIMAQGKFGEETVRDIVPMKNATISMVEAFKAAKHMQKNMLFYLNSNNEAIKHEYNHIRRNIIKVLRNIQLILNTNEEDIAVMLLGKIKLDAQKYDIAANKSLDNLIRTQQISYAMATSLMNDSTYAYTIASELAEVAQILFVHHEQEGKETREALILNESDMKDLSTHLS